MKRYRKSYCSCSLWNPQRRPSFSLLATPLMTSTHSLMTSFDHWSTEPAEHFAWSAFRLYLCFSCEFLIRVFCIMVWTRIATISYTNCIHSTSTLNAFVFHCVLIDRHRVHVFIFEKRFMHYKFYIWTVSVLYIMTRWNTNSRIQTPKVFSFMFQRPHKLCTVCSNVAWKVCCVLTGS